MRGCRGGYAHLGRARADIQVTDLHLGWPASTDPGSALAASVAAALDTLGGPPDAVIVSGDVAHSAAESEYREARSLLERFGAPLYAIPGNHDEPAALARHFVVPTASEPSVGYAVRVGPVHLVALDTTSPGVDGGRLDRGRLEWLARALDSEPATPTLLAMHHPPILTGMPAMDDIGIAERERWQLEQLLLAHAQVTLIAAGHVHRAIVSRLAHATVVAIPSTDMQLALDLEAPEITIVPEPPCFALHVLVDDRFVSHIQTIERPAE